MYAHPHVHLPAGAFGAGDLPLHADVQEAAAGRAHLLQNPSSGDQLWAKPPGKLPCILHMTGQQLQQLRDRVTAGAGGQRATVQQSTEDPAVEHMDQGGADEEALQAQDAKAEPTVKLEAAWEDAQAKQGQRQDSDGNSDMPDFPD
jgi:hypothetical protein